MDGRRGQSWPERISVFGMVGWQSGRVATQSSVYLEARRRAFVYEGHNGGRPGESVKDRVNSIKGFERITEPAFGLV